MLFFKLIFSCTLIFVTACNSDDTLGEWETDHPALINAESAPAMVSRYDLDENPLITYGIYLPSEDFDMLGATDDTVWSTVDESVRLLMKEKPSLFGENFHTDSQVRIYLTHLGTGEFEIQEVDDKYFGIILNLDKYNTQENLSRTISGYVYDNISPDISLRDEFSNLVYENTVYEFEARQE